MKIVLDSAAVSEMEQAALFYEDCREGLGHEFMTSVEDALNEIARYPTVWRRMKGDFRRYLVHRFPYGIIYALDGDTIYVAAVMHLKRKPDYWESRRL